MERQNGAGFGRPKKGPPKKSKHYNPDIIGKPVRLILHTAGPVYGMFRDSDIEKTILDPSLINLSKILGGQERADFVWQKDFPCTFDTRDVIGIQPLPPEQEQYLEYLVESTPHITGIIMPNTQEVFMYGKPIRYAKLIP